MKEYGEHEENLSDQARGFFRKAENDRQQGDYEEAIEACLAGLERTPESLSGRMLLGRCYLGAGEIARAKEEMEKVAQKIEECLPVYEWLSQIYTEEHNVEKALEAARKALYFSTSGPENRGISPAEMHFVHGASKPPFAPPPKNPPQFSKTIGKKETAPIPTDTLAEIYIKQGHLQKALSIYEKILKWEPENSAVRAKYEELKKRAGGGRHGLTREKTIQRLERWLACVSRAAGA